MRIVGGKFAGRDLTSPNDFRVRPTGELVRAAMLDRLAEHAASHALPPGAELERFGETSVSFYGLHGAC